MIKHGLKNFAYNLKYFFTPLGTLALGVVIGLSILIPGVISSAATLAENVKTILAGSSIDFTVLQDSVVKAVGDLDWNNPLSALQTMISEEWLTDTLNACIDALIQSSEVYTLQLNAAVEEFIGAAAVYFTILAFFIVAGIAAGFFLTKFLVRRNMAKRAFRKYFLVSAIDTLLVAAAAILTLWLYALWQPSVFISTFVWLFICGVIALIEAYAVHGYKKIGWKKVINAKNAALLLATNLIIFILAWVATIITVVITNGAVGLFVGFALFEIALIVISMNAESYVKTVADSLTDSGVKEDCEPSAPPAAA